MNITGHYTFLFPIERVYEALQDEALIREALPGHVYFRMTSPTRYEAAMELDVPKFGGRYSGELEVVESKVPTFYRLHAQGTGPERAMSAQGTVTLHPIEPERTELHYAGTTDALSEYNRLFQKMAEPLAVRLANRGLAHLERIMRERDGES